MNVSTPGPKFVVRGLFDPLVPHAEFQTGVQPIAAVPLFLKMQVARLCRREGVESHKTMIFKTE